MQVQFGKREDIAEWMKLVEDIRWNYPGLETKEAIAEHRETVLRFIHKAQALCVKDGAEIVGVCLFSRGRNMICCLGVSPKYRRCGIASMLLSKTLEQLDRTKDISVSTFREEDEKGTAPRALYKKFGFVEDELIEEFGYPNQRFVWHPEQIQLIEPNSTYTADIWAFRQEILDCDAENEDQFAGCMSLDTSKSAEEWIKICELRKSEETCGETGTAVPTHMYLAVRKGDNRIVGVIDLRHHINHPILGTWGGHCGYSVRPSERGKGYAKEMLRLNIQNAKVMGIQKLLITCDVSNEASERTILSNGGVYEKTIEVDGSRMKRYWITV